MEQRDNLVDLVWQGPTDPWDLLDVLEILVLGVTPESLPSVDEERTETPGSAATLDLREDLDSLDSRVKKVGRDPLGSRCPLAQWAHRVLKESWVLDFRVPKDHRVILVCQVPLALRGPLVLSVDQQKKWR